VRERRLLQALVALGCVVRFSWGGGMVHGPRFLHGVGAGAPADLDSHFRYLPACSSVGAMELGAVPLLVLWQARWRLEPIRLKGFRRFPAARRR
jgi:hypothetical protein